MALRQRRPKVWLSPRRVGYFVRELAHSVEIAEIRRDQAFIRLCNRVPAVHEATIVDNEYITRLPVDVKSDRIGGTLNGLDNPVGNDAAIVEKGYSVEPQIVTGKQQEISKCEFVAENCPVERRI